MAHQLTSN
jgi:2-oxoisovalerate dehydrogenase E1 component alpha subunit